MRVSPRRRVAVEPDAPLPTVTVFGGPGGTGGAGGGCGWSGGSVATVVRVVDVVVVETWEVGGAGRGLTVDDGAGVVGAAAAGGAATRLPTDGRRPGRKVHKPATSSRPAAMALQPTRRDLRPEPPSTALHGTGQAREPPRAGRREDNP